LGFVVTTAPFITFFPGIILGASLGGWRPGLVATLLGAAAADVSLLGPRDSFGIHGAADRYAVGRLVLTGVFISGLGESLRRSHRRIPASERRHAVTLASKGDAVIATDHQARVTSLNPVAEREAAHQLSGMVAASSGVAGGAASGREDHAAQGQLEGSRPLAARLETMAEEWLRPVGGPSLDALRESAGP
jgi:K+-sensing histidine kinase KdpD